jgi:hypothetical protein
MVEGNNANENFHHFNGINPAGVHFRGNSSFTRTNQDIRKNSGLWPP